MRKKLITTQSKSMRCEIHTCKGITDFSIGLEGFRTAYTNVCKDCLDTIVRQAGELLYGRGWTPEVGFQSIIEEQEDPFADNVDDIGSEDGVESLGECADDVFAESQGNVQENEQIPPQEPEELDTDKYYICEDCGEKFKKPAEKMQYVSHRKKCKSELANGEE